MMKFADLAIEYTRSEEKFLDKFWVIGSFDFNEVRYDGTNSSIEFFDVDSSGRLNEEQQKLCWEEGFLHCWLNHDDGSQTYYNWYRHDDPNTFNVCEGERKVNGIWAEPSSKSSNPSLKKEGKGLKKRLQSLFGSMVK